MGVHDHFKVRILTGLVDPAEFPQAHRRRVPRSLRMQKGGRGGRWGKRGRGGRERGEGEGGGRGGRGGEGGRGEMYLFAVFVASLTCPERIDLPLLAVQCQPTFVMAPKWHPAWDHSACVSLEPARLSKSWWASETTPLAGCSSVPFLGGRDIHGSFLPRSEQSGAV